MLIKDLGFWEGNTRLRDRKWHMGWFVWEKDALYEMKNLLNRRSLVNDKIDCWLWLLIIATHFRLNLLMMAF